MLKSISLIPYGKIQNCQNTAENHVGNIYTTNVPVTSNIYSVIPEPGFISLTLVHHTIARVVFLEVHSRGKSSKRKSIREITVSFRVTRAG